MALAVGDLTKEIMMVIGSRLLLPLSILMFVLVSQNAFAGSVLLSYSKETKPANDLIYNGQIYDSDGAMELKHKGVDLGKLNPEANDLWQNQKLPLSNENEIGYPREEMPTLDFDSLMPSPTSSSKDDDDGHVLLAWARVTYNGRPYRIGASLGLHGMLMRAALLRTLGYNIPSPKYYRQIKIRFQSDSDRTVYLNHLSDQLLVHRDRWVVDYPKDKWEVTLRDIAIEPARIDVPPYHWGVVLSGYLEDRRAARALIVPLSFLDVNESINRFKWEAGNVTNDSANLSQPFAAQFAESTIDDARWLGFKIAALTSEELIQIVRLGHWPAEIEALLIEKIMARRNHLLSLLKIRGTHYPFNAGINIGTIVNGKVTQEHYEGYPQRFTYGDPQSPLTLPELARFGFLMGISAGISQAVIEVNKRLDFLNMDSLQQKRIDGLQKDFIKAFEKNPFAPYKQPLTTWGGWIGGVGIDASRNLVTGTYYGTDQAVLKQNPLQLVDIVGVHGSVGYFLGFDGVNQNVFPGLTAGLAMQRSYVHVRPVASVKAAMKVKWQDLYIPGFMTSLAKIMKLDSQITSKDVNATIKEEDIKKRNDETDKALKAFLDEFKYGEMFTITDTLAMDAGLQVQIPLMYLLPMSPYNTNPAIDFSAGVEGIVMRRTTITRTEDGIHIYIQRLNSIAEKMALDLTFWIKFAELAPQLKQGSVNTKAYLLDANFYDQRGNPRDNDNAARMKFAYAVNQVLRNNNVERLEKDFTFYKLKHKLSAVMNTWKVLFFQRTDLSEKHLLKIQPPTPADNSYKPQDYERTLYSYRDTEYSGRRYLPTISDIASKYAKRNLAIFDNPGPNPAYSFFGESVMTELKTDGEVTAGKLEKPVTTTTHSWQGWILGRERLAKIFDALDAQIRVVNSEIPLIRREQFLVTSQIQFYDIRSTLLIYEKGINKLIDTLVYSASRQPTLAPSKDNLRHFGSDAYTATDAQVIDAMADLMGRSEFTKYCSKMQEEQFNKPNSVFINAYHYGYIHPCIAGWMIKILDLRRHFPKDPTEQIEWVSKVMSSIQDNVELGYFLKWLGNKNFFFQVRVGGFRKNDELGDRDYVSDSVGNFDDDLGAGVFRDFITKYKILGNEVEAKYFSEGY